MKVFITGATGVVGERLVNKFSNKGHEVVGLARDQTGERTVKDAGGVPHHGDVFEKDTLYNGAKGADVVVHAATALPTETKTTEEDWNKNDQVRLTGGRNVLDAAKEVGADQFITHSVVWAVRAEDGSEIDESSPPNTDRTTESAIEFERVVQNQLKQTDITATTLRLGWLYGPESGQFKNMGEFLADGDLPVIGSGLLGRGDTTVSLLHTEDAARAMVTAAEQEASGLYHVVDNQPVTTAEFFEEFAAQMGVDEPSSIPPWIAKFFVGNDMVQFLTNDFPTSNQQFAATTGWEPKYSTYREGIRDIVQTWAENDEIISSTEEATATA